MKDECKNLRTKASDNKWKNHLIKRINYGQMKNIKYLIVVIFLMSIIIKGQEKLTVPPPPPPFFELNEQTEKEFLKNIDAELKIKLQNIKEFNKQEYLQLLSELQFAKFEHGFLDLREKRDNELERKILAYEIETKSLLAKLKKSDASEKSKLKSELKNSVSELFDLKEERRKKEIDRLNERLIELNKKMKVRSKNKDEIVKRRVQELLGESDYLDWD